MRFTASVDVVLCSWLLYAWIHEARSVEGILREFHRVLKPGGVLGVVDHRGNPAIPQDPKAASGYVNQNDAVRLIEAAGFRLVGVSEINANPRDTRDHGKGVWSLPPTYAEGDKDRARYAAIGESDRMTLRFRKPAK